MYLFLGAAGTAMMDVEIIGRRWKELREEKGGEWEPSGERREWEGRGGGRGPV